MTHTGHGGDLISLEGAIDLHFHTYPDLFPRLTDDLEVAQLAAAEGMRALVLKSHIESTVSRAYLTRRLVPQVEVYGGIVLNTYVGGLNPAAVDAALRLGGKIVWMPTIDSAYHAERHGGTGRYDAQSGGRVSQEGISILDADGRLVPQVDEIVELVVEHGAALATAHLSPREIKQLVPHALKAGVEKMIITHPFFKVPGLALDELAELAALGAMPEFEYCGMSAAWQYQSSALVVEAVRRIGASRCLLVSDSGQRHNPAAPEGLRVLAQTLYERGLPAEDVRRMLVDNPAAVLGLDRERAAPSAEERAYAAGLLARAEQRNGAPLEPALAGGDGGA